MRISFNSDLTSHNMTLYFAMWLYITQLHLYFLGMQFISHCDFKFCSCDLISHSVALSRKMTLQLAILDLFLVLISLYLSTIMTLYLTKWFQISQFEFTSHSWLYISRVWFYVSYLYFIVRVFYHFYSLFIFTLRQKRTCIQYVCVWGRATGLSECTDKHLRIQ